MVFRLILGFAGFIAGWLLGSRRGPAQTASSPSANEPRLSALTEEISGLREVAGALRESVTGLDKQLGRVGREQFKANTLGEAQQQQVLAALEELRETNARREADLARLRDQLRADQSAQRLSVIEQLLPVLDGLDEALAAGKRLLARAPQPGRSQPPTLTFQQRVALAFGRGDLPAMRAEGTDESRTSITAWLEGIELVRERLLQVLAAEGVQPVMARGQVFDPHRHVAVERVPAVDGMAPGTVVEEYRRGYQVGEKILRASEVVVARTESANE